MIISCSCAQTKVNLLLQPILVTKIRVTSGKLPDRGRTGGGLLGVKISFDTILKLPRLHGSALDVQKLWISLLGRLEMYEGHFADMCTKNWGDKWTPQACSYGELGLPLASA